MIWPPLVSARAYREVVAERDRLREQNDALTDQLVRIARRREGMSEMTPERKQERRIEIPPDVQREIDAFESAAIRSQRKARVLAVYRQTGNWQEAKAVISEEAG